MSEQEAERIAFRTMIKLMVYGSFLYITAVGIVLIAKWWLHF